MVGFFPYGMDMDGIVFLSHPVHFVLLMGGIMLLVIVVSAR